MRTSSPRIGRSVCVFVNRMPNSEWFPIFFFYIYIYMVVFRCIRLALLVVDALGAWVKTMLAGVFFFQNNNNNNNQNVSLVSFCRFNCTEQQRLNW
jgi:hypothetical protein